MNTLSNVQSIRSLSHSDQQHKHSHPHNHNIKLHFLSFHSQQFITCFNSQQIKQTKMATVTSASIKIPTFTTLKTTSRPTTATFKPTPKFAIKASLKDFGVAVAATAASALIASNAMAMDVLLGGDDGSLAFIPGSFEVAAGEKITFKNNAGFPHNVVFDEDECPSGVNTGAISMNEEDYLNAKDEIYSVTLTEKGTYSFYCAPHQGAGMVGKVTVK